MPRELSQAALRGILAQTTGELYLFLLRLKSENMSTMRFVRNDENVSSRGDTYMAYPFDIQLPGDSDDEIMNPKLVIDNVDRSIIEEVRQIQTPITVEIEVVLYDTPDTVEVGPYNFKLRAVTYDAQRIEGELRYEADFLDQRFPKLRFSPANSPGMFG